MIAAVASGLVTMTAWLSMTTPPAPVGDVWAALAACESGGDPATDTGNGYFGLVQFDEPTWLWMGGDDFAPLPHLATAAEQLVVAERLRAHEVEQGRGGFGPWPGCARAIGLPT